MWLQNIDTFDFLNWDGYTYNVKEIKDIDLYSNIMTYPVTDKMTLDDIASRNEVYGENHEDYSWKILEANAVDLFENNFSFSNVKSIKIPIGLSAQ